MPTVRVTITTPLSPARVMQILTDFGPSRAGTWVAVDEQHYQVHDQGDNWADVTEGNNLGWERERYTWDLEAGTVSAVTTDSNLWAAGSRWDYKLTPRDGSTDLEVTLQRKGKSLKGKLIGALLPLFGKSTIRNSVSGALITT